MQSSLPVSNLSNSSINPVNPPKVETDNRSVIDAVIVGAVKGALFGVGAFFMTLAGTAYSLNILALPVALAVGLGVGVIVGIYATIIDYFVRQPNMPTFKNSSDEMDRLHDQMQKNWAETAKSLEIEKEVRAQFFAKPVNKP